MVKFKEINFSYIASIILGTLKNLILYFPMLLCLSILAKDYTKFHIEYNSILIFLCISITKVSKIEYQQTHKMISEIRNKM